MAGRIASFVGLALLVFAEPVIAVDVCSGSPACPGELSLQLLGVSTIEIDLAWQPLPGATRYLLERSADCGFASPTSYTLSSFTTAYGDTGKAPTAKDRFAPPYLLNPSSTYYYRVRAQLADGSERVSDCESASLATETVVGSAGDFSADSVLGQPDFYQNEFRKTTPRAVQWSGGISVDRTRVPNRIYISDNNHNRIVGIDRLGHCANQTACVSDSDCAPGTCALEYPDTSAAVILGQPSGTDKAACNGDGTGRLYPARAPATQSSLCLIRPEQLTVGETVSSIHMDVDDSGALFVPDEYNHRVLRWSNPGGAGQAADGLWGQATYAENSRNRGAAAPTASSLSFSESIIGVAADHEGHLWVADYFNHRVLRFPKSGGSIATGADIVLGQSSCTANVDYGSGRTLNQFARPLDVAVDRANRKLYVVDVIEGGESRILEFDLPAALPAGSGCAPGNLTGRSLLRNYGGRSDFACTPQSLALDVNPQNPSARGLWVVATPPCFDATMFDLTTLAPRYAVNAAQLNGVDLDRDGNLFVVTAWDEIYRLKRSTMISNGLNETANRDAMQPIFVAGRNPPTADALYGAGGAAVLGATPGAQQLVVSDGHRVVMWQQFDSQALTQFGQPFANGAPADDVYGEADLTSETWNAEWYAFPQVNNGQLYIQRRYHTDVAVFDPPFTRHSTPVRSIPLQRTDSFSGYPVLGYPGSTAAPKFFDYTDFALSASGNEMWIADICNSRILRVANVRGARGTQYVDVIIGQPNLTESPDGACYHELCNHGDDSCDARGPQYCPRADSLCNAAHVTLDAADNVYVSDHGFEQGSTNRILEFDASRFPTGGTKAILGPVATRVFGTAGVFDKVGGTQSDADPMLRPFKPAFHPSGAFFVGQNPYDSGFPTGSPPSRYASVYLQPLVESMPQLTLGDLTAYPDNLSYVDPQTGNILFADRNWARVLFYKSPFAGVSAPACAAYRNAVLDAAPYAYWRLDESAAGCARDTAGSNHGAYLGQPSSVASALASDLDPAISFDQADDFIDITDVPTLRLTDSFAIEMWVKLNDTLQQADLLSRSGYAVRANSGALTLHAPNHLGNCDPEPLSTIRLGDTSWHHVVYSFNNADNIFTGYVDGQQVFAQFCEFNLPDTPGLLRIGAASDDSSNANAAFDEVALYAHALSAWQVRGHFEIGRCSSSPPAGATPPVACDVPPTSTPQSTPTASPTPLPCSARLNNGALRLRSLHRPAGLQSVGLRGVFNPAAIIDPRSTSIELKVSDAAGTTIFSRIVPAGAPWVLRHAAFSLRDKGVLFPGTTSIRIGKPTLRGTHVRWSSRLVSYSAQRSQLPLQLTLKLGGGGDQCAQIEFNASTPAPYCSAPALFSSVTCRLAALPR